MRKGWWNLLFDPERDTAPGNNFQVLVMFVGNVVFLTLSVSCFSDPVLFNS